MVRPKRLARIKARQEPAREPKPLSLHPMLDLQEPAPKKTKVVKKAKVVKVVKKAPKKKA